MEPNKKVSVIVFTRNNPEELEAFLAMMELQTYKNHEIIIVDESEGTDISDKYEGYLDYYKEKFHGDWGQSIKETAGKELAIGEVLCFPNADAYYTPTFLATMMKPHNEGTAEVTYCNYLRHHNNYEFTEAKIELGRTGIVNFLINKELFNRIGWNDKGPCGDYGLMKDAKNAGARFVKVPGVLCVNN